MGRGGGGTGPYQEFVGPQGTKDAGLRFLSIVYMPQYKNKSQEELRIEDLRKAGKMPGGAQANTQLTLPQQPGAAAGGFGFGSPAPAAAPTAGSFMGDTTSAPDESPSKRKTGKERFYHYLTLAGSRYGLSPVTNLTTSLRDGLVLTALVHMRRPDLVQDPRELKNDNVDGVTVLTDALSAMETHLGMPKMLDAADVGHDENSALTFLSTSMRATMALWPLKYCPSSMWRVARRRTRLPPPGGAEKCSCE